MMEKDWKSIEKIISTCWLKYTTTENPILQITSQNDLIPASHIYVIEKTPENVRF